MNFQEKYERETAKQEALLTRKNEKTDDYNGIYDRYKYPVLTAAHAPILWRSDLNPETNPHFMERLGLNAGMNAGAIELDGKICLVARVEGNDRKYFFAVAESENGAVLGAVSCDPEYRKHGYGSSIVKYISNRLIEENKAVFLHRAKNANVSFYNNLGFVETDKWREYFFER